MLGSNDFYRRHFIFSFFIDDKSSVLLKPQLVFVVTARKIVSSLRKRIVSLRTFILKVSRYGITTKL